ncbi:DUF1566 domain-containing protein [bacterium]|nr:DUF1566 domain-containing protein [bacterium]
MKKIFAVFALFATLTFVISCGGGSSKIVVEGSESEKNTGELGGECYGNGTCNRGLICDEESNICVEDPENPSEQTDDNVDTSSDPNAPQTPCNPNPCKDVANSTGSCAVVDEDYACGCLEHYSWTGSVCKADSRVADCTGLPANATWNTAESISQTWDGEAWYPSETGTYNSNPSSSECRFKCEPDYDWNGWQCASTSTPCNPNPCTSISNSTGVCTVNGTGYTCGCQSGYTWNGGSCQSNGGSSLPECSASSGTPCKDSSSGLTWSARASTSYTWQIAVDYCNSYSEGGLSGWHLPTISELRTLIKNCSGTVTGGSCGVTDSCLSSSCQDESCYSCDYYEDGRYSKFGEIGWFWSSSTISDPGYAWLVFFNYGRVGGSNKTDSYPSVRCVR